MGNAMLLTVTKDMREVLFRRVFGHAVFKQSLLYHHKVCGVVLFELAGERALVDEVINRTQNDQELCGITVLKQESDAATGTVIPLNRLYYGDSFVDVFSEADVETYRRAYAVKIRQNTQTPIAKHINKRLSLPLSRILASQTISPNIISAIALLWSLVGALCLLTREYYVLGFLCFQINSVLDGCDGEVARFNFAFSEFGKKLDVYCDYLTTIIIIVFEAVGFYLLCPTLWVLVLAGGSLALLVMIGVLSFMSKKSLGNSGSFNDLEVLCHQRLAHPQNLWDRVNSLFLFVSHRDFYILAILILAMMGQFAVIHIFLSLLCLSWTMLSLHTYRITHTALPQ